MSTVGPVVPLPPASVIPTYSPLGKPVVGNETAEEKDRALPPVEQGEASERSRNRVESKPESERRDRQPEQQHETPDGAATPEVTGPAAPPATGSGVPTIRILPTGHADAVGGRAALDAFNQPAIDPGLLLDQRV